MIRCGRKMIKNIICNVKDWVSGLIIVRCLIISVMIVKIINLLRLRLVWEEMSFIVLKRFFGCWVLMEVCCLLISLLNINFVVNVKIRIVVMDRVRIWIGLVIVFVNRVVSFVIIFVKRFGSLDRWFKVDEVRLVSVV